MNQLSFDIEPPALRRTTPASAPHPIPYQGSKRRLATKILAYFPLVIEGTLYEPFAGSAAMTIAAMHSGRADRAVIADSLLPLCDLWDAILNDPDYVISAYAAHWNRGKSEGLPAYYDVRDKFNVDNDPTKLYYLLARCVKAAVRFNDKGEFNQSADKRRLGATPDRIAREVRGVSSLLQGKVEIRKGDYRRALSDATEADFVYLDPPWEGTSGERDTRYFETLRRDELIAELERLNDLRVPFLLSFDGRMGDRKYGRPLPASLGLQHVEVHAGRSSQATLTGSDAETFESLYLSPHVKCVTASVSSSA